MNRNHFLQQSFIAAGISILPKFSLGNTVQTKATSPFILGPLEGYSPYIGTLVSEMIYMRTKLLHTIKALNPSIADLDFLIDSKANSIGALLSHLAATDVIYHATTIDKREGYNAEEKLTWEVPMNLGEKARTQIKGQPLEYYLGLLKDTREKTLEAFKKKDDKWLMEISPKGFANLPTNTFCFWFHVTEHEAHHLGQIDLIKKRLPSAKPDKEG